MKILLINSMCGSGSTGRIVVDLYNKIKEQGDTAKVAYGIGRASGVPQEDIFRITNRAGYYLHNILAKITDRTGLYSSIETRRLVRWIRKYDPDLVHLHNLHGYYINYRILFNYLAKHNKKVVWTLHDCWSFTGHCAHFVKVKCDGWENGCLKCKNINIYPKSYFFSNSNRNLVLKKQLLTNIHQMTIVCPSQWLAEIANNTFLNVHTIKVINNGIDLSVFYQEKGDFRNNLGLEDKKILLGVASNWNQAKGFDDFIALSEMINDDTVIVLVGVTINQKKQLKENMIGILSTQNIDELRMIYSESDVFLNLTYEDTFPTVNMESLACGTPVITYRTGGSGEIVNDSCGRIAKVGDLDDVLNKVQECLSLNREDCRSHAITFDKNNKYKQYLEVYHS